MNPTSITVHGYPIFAAPVVIHLNAIIETLNASAYIRPRYINIFPFLLGIVYFISSGEIQRR